VARKKLTAPTFKIRKERTRKSSDSIDIRRNVIILSFPWMNRLSRSDSSVAGNTDFLSIFLIAANAPGGSTPDTSPKRPQNHDHREHFSLIWNILPYIPGFLQHHLSIFPFALAGDPLFVGFVSIFGDRRFLQWWRLRRDQVAGIRLLRPAPSTRPAISAGPKTNEQLVCSLEKYSLYFCGFWAPPQHLT
jgi:hypothetical protein